MPKFSVNLDSMVNSMSKRSYKVSDVADKIEKVAFDIYKFKDGKQDELWQIQSADDGDYIVALYDEELKAEASVYPWNVLVKNADIHFFYNQEHICKVAANSLGFKDQDLNLAQRYLPQKLSANKNLVKALLKSVDKDTVKALLAKYPELA